MPVCSFSGRAGNRRTRRRVVVLNAALPHCREFARFLPQLTQTLKYEPYADSALARLLLKRSWASPVAIGLKVYWFLRVETYYKEFAPRYGTVAWRAEARSNVCVR